jgi:valyl-tRNA synthetase
MVRAASPGQDVPLAEEWIEGARNFVNKLWNASRFVAMNLDGKGLKDFEPVSAEEAEAFPAMDRWIMSRMRSSLSRVDHGFEQ